MVWIQPFLTLVDCRESSTLIKHLLKSTPISAIDWIQIRAVWGHMHGSMNVTFSRYKYVGVFLAVPALLLQDVTVTLDNN